LSTEVMKNGACQVNTALDYLNDQATQGGTVIRATNQSAKIKRAILFLLVVTSTLSWGPCFGAAPIYSDRVAAVVNGDVILESEVKEQKQPFVRQNFAMPLGVVPPGKWPTEKEILDELVIIRLLEQEASKKGIQMTDQGLDSAIASLRKRNNLSYDKFIMFLAAKGLNYADYRKMMKRQMVLSALVSRELNQKAAVTEKDAQEYYKENKDKIDEQYEKLMERLTASREPQEEEKPKVPTHKEVFTGGKLRLRQIILHMTNPADKKEKEKIIQTVHKIFDDVKTGADFGQLAKKYSQDSSSSKGGDLGFLDYRDMSPNMQKLVQQMKVGEVAPPLSTKNSLIILNLAEAKNRKVNKVPIPAAERKKLEKQIDEMYEKRKAERERAQAEQKAAATKPKEESAADAEKQHETKGVKKNSEKDPGILTGKEKEAYEKERDKVMSILRSQKMQAAMKEWVEDLKKNSIIEERL
jgi:peptidyl-prolyl cis-trans isomerase SurA